MRCLFIVVLLFSLSLTIHSTSAATTCTPGQQQNTTTFACTDCLPGTFSTSANSTTCTACASGTHTNGASNATVCLGCAAGSYVNTTTSLCVVCAPGSFNSGTNQIVCALAPYGRFVATNGSAVSTPCANGGYADVLGLPACKSCAAGTFPNSTVTGCTPCPVGQFGLAGNQSCTVCAAGTYQSVIGSTTCSLCPPGTKSTATGSVDRTACTLCGVGYSSVAGATTCTQCLAGTASGETDPICSVCPAGKYSDVDGAAVCTSCGVGQYQSATNSTSCSYCKAGTYQDMTGATSAGWCVACAQGSISAVGVSVCTACAADRTTTGVGLPVCNQDVPGVNDTLTDCATCRYDVPVTVGGLTEVQFLPCRKAVLTTTVSLQCLLTMNGTLHPTYNLTDSSLVVLVDSNDHVLYQDCVIPAAFLPVVVVDTACHDWDIRGHCYSNSQYYGMIIVPVLVVLVAAIGITVCIMRARASGKNIVQFSSLSARA